MTRALFGCDRAVFIIVTREYLFLSVLIIIS
jgi:hypothetical protein